MRRKPIIRFTIPFIIISVVTFYFSCTEKKDRVMTVNGWMDAEEMGVTLPHEHIMVDWTGADSIQYAAWNQDSVAMTVKPYLDEIKEQGCQTFIDCTPSYLGHDPLVYKELSELTGLHIIFAVGYYGAIENKYIPRHAWDETSEQLANRWLDEWENGVSGTGIRPGIIKIGVPFDTTLSELHQKLVRAAARAHLQSGLTIVAHTGPGERAYEELEILKDEGVSPEAFVWTHALLGTMEDHIEIARSGAWVSFDWITTNPEDIQQIVELIKNMKENDLLHKLLLSHDAGWYTVGEPGGGDFRPYTAIFTHLIPAMKQAGFTDEDISQIMEKNPQEAYAIKIRKI
jgi:phosphotriesterase-related protein